MLECELGPGTYTVEITDKNGCKGTKSITIVDEGGSLEVDLEATAASCGQKGSMWVTIKNGSPKYTVELWGPSNATFWAQTSSNSFKLSELTAGDYTLKITDKNGCSVTTTKTVAGTSSNLGLTLEVNNATCQDDGRIWVTINGGTADYKLRWSGPVVSEVYLSTTGYQINNLKAGNYTIYVTDKNGCTYSESVSVYGSGNNLSLALESNKATCSQNGFLWADVKNGVGPYQVSWTGATDGSMNVSSPGFQVSDLPAGNYTVSVTDKNGCGVSEPITVYSESSDVDFSLEANNGACGENGYVWVTIGNGDGPYHISWAGPQTGEAASSDAGYQISDLPGGTYWVTVKDKNGCQSVEEINVVGTAAFSATTQLTNATCGSGGQIWIDMAGGNAPFDIKLEGPMLGQTSTSDIKYHFPNVPAGTYTLTLTDYSGCVITKTIIISTTGSTITADIETNNAFCNQKGSAWLTMSSGSAPYTVSWTGPVNGSGTTNTSGFQMTNLPAGAYAVVITDKHGCYVNKSITINSTGNSLHLSLEANSASCGQKGAIWVTTTGGSAPYNVSWTGPSSSSIQTNDSGYQIASLESGTYTVTVKDNNGCSTVQSVTVGNNVQDFSIAVETTDATCGGKGFAWITMFGGSANYTISWTGTSSGTSTSGGTGYKLDNLPVGTYTISVKEFSGCEDSQTITIKDNGSNIGLTTQVTAAGCSSKGSIYASISGGTAGFSYSWTGPVNGSTSTSATSYTIDNLPGGTYTVTVRDSKGCESTQTVTVTDSGSNLGLSTQVTAAGCSSKGSIYASISGGTAGFSYSWTGPVNGSTSTSVTSYRIDNLPAGTYAITVRDSKGCEATQTTVVTGGGSDVTLTSDVTDAVCGSNGSIWMTVSGGSSDYTYIWAGAAAGSIISSETGYNVQNLPAGSYNLTVRDANGCESSQSVTIKATGSNIGLTLEAKNASCNGKGAIYASISGGTAGFSYSWAGPVSGSTSTSSTGYNIDNLPAGTYKVTVRDSKGCSTSESITVNSEGGVLRVDLSSTSSVACEHDGSTLVSIDGGSAPYTISYTGPTTGSVQTSDDNYLVSGLLPGDYVFSITDVNGCSGTRKITVYDNGSDLAVSLTPTDAACGSKGKMVVKITGGISNYIISWVGGGINGSVTTGDKSFVLTDLPIGTYSIEVKDGIGCTVKETASISSLGGNLGIQLFPKNDVCGQGGSIEVRLDGGVADYQIEWSGPISGTATSNSSVYTIGGLSVAGNYSVIVTDANGCEAKEWVAINTGGAINFGLVGTNATCNSGGEILVNISSGAPDYTINWSGPSSGTTVISTNVFKVDNLTKGTYTITIKDNKGCENSKSIVIDGVGTDLDLSLTNTNTSCGTANGSINATVSYGVAPYTFNWAGPVNGSKSINDANYTIVDLPAGNYTVSAVDANGCVVNRGITISESGNALGLSVVGKDAICGQPSSIQVTISNGVPNFKIEWTGPTNGATNTSANSYTISDVANGTYTVTTTDASNCSKSQVVVINSNTNDVSFSYETKDATCTSKGSIWLTISNGNGPYNIEWSGPSSGSSTSADSGVQITELLGGVYTVTVHDKNGCSISQTIEVKNIGTGGTAVNFANKPTPLTCNNEGTILLTMISGTAPYTVTWTGPTSGTRTASASDILIEDLTFGTYSVTVTGAGGCGSKTNTIEVEDKRVVLGVTGSVMNGVCGEKGSVQLSWTGDRDPYTISWTGTTIGSLATNANSETISDLKNGTYTFTVTGFDGCTGKYEATIDNGGTSSAVNFTYSNSGKTISFTNLSPAGTYAWTFGDGTSSTDMSPTHTYEKNGTYTVCLNVTNSCGTKQKCQTVSVNAVTSTDPSAKVVLGDMSGPKGKVLQLPVRVEHCTKLGTLSGTIMLGNSNVATIMGLSPNAISPVYNSGNHTFSYLSSGTGMNITSETILFYINVQLIGGVGQSSTIDLSSLPVALELTCTENGFSSPVTPEVARGRVSISTSAQIADVGGTVKTYWGDGVGDAMVTISSIDHEMNPMTSIDGEYVADEVPMGYEYTFTPSKTSNPANGLSTFGLFLTQKYILGYEPAEIESPYQVVAMDANCSGTLTTFDLFAMQQMLIGNITEFPGCNSWVFVSADHEFPAEFDNRNVFPYADSHTMMLESESATADFIGVKVGDVLGRAVPVDNAINTFAEDRNRQIVPIQIDQRAVKAGETFEVDFRAADLADMVSFQLGLDFNPQTLEFVEFIPSVKGDLVSAVAGVQNNQLKISWYDPAGTGINATASEEMFTLKFVAKQNISNLIEQIQLNNRTFMSELHKSTNDAYRFKLELNSTLNSTFKVHQNTPNPFKDFTTITIEMPQEADAEIILHDNFGRTIRTTSHTLKAGINQLPIKRASLGAGVYYYTVKAGDFVDTKRMLIIE